MCTSNSSSPIGSSSSRRLHSRASLAPLNHPSPLNFTGLATIQSLNLVSTPAPQPRTVAGRTIRPCQTQERNNESCVPFQEKPLTQKQDWLTTQHHFVWLHHAMRLLAAAYCITM